MSRAERRGGARRALAVAVGVALLGLALWWASPEGLSWRGAVPRAGDPRAVDQRAADQAAPLAPALERAAAGVARTWLAEHHPEALAFRWGEGVLMLGLDCTALRARAADAAAIDAYVRRYYDAHARAGTAFTFTWSDEVTPAIAAASRLARGEAAHARVVADAVAYVRSAPRIESSGALTHFGRSPLRHLAPPFPEAWVDTLFHVVPLLVRHGRMTGDARDLDAAAAQVIAFLRAVQDPQSALVTHAFSERAGRIETQPPLAARVFWLRGQGWVLASGVEAWAALPAAHPLRGELGERLRRLARALIARQAPSGLFHTLVTRPDTYLETAGSALVIAALAHGARVALLDAGARRAAEHGMRGLLAIVERDGARHVIPGTSLGTNPWPALYAHVPTASQVSYGVGAWLLAACELRASLEAAGPPR